jgi:hypothetical protein
MIVPSCYESSALLRNAFVTFSILRNKTDRILLSMGRAFSKSPKPAYTILSSPQ